jgi:hypothetical protein
MPGRLGARLDVTEPKPRCPRDDPLRTRTQVPRTPVEMPQWPFRERGAEVTKTTGGQLMRGRATATIIPAIEAFMLGKANHTLDVCFPDRDSGT